MSIIILLLVGLIAGALAGMVIDGGGLGIVMDIVVGVLGSFLGGWLFSALGIGVGMGLIGEILVAFVGACILLLILRAVTRGSRRGYGRRRIL